MLTHEYLRGKEKNVPPTYRAWQAMKNRCLNKAGINYNNYGGRGITVCDEWRNSFVNFYKDMGERPSNKYSLDRIDNNGNYCKQNCRWATKIQQANNTRFNRKINYNGKEISLKDFGKKVNLKRKALSWRIHNGWTIEEIKNNEKIKYTIRRKKILELRKKGLTQQEIGDKVGLSDSRVGDILSKFVNQKCSA